MPRPDHFYDAHLHNEQHCLDFKRSQPFLCNYTHQDVHKREQFNVLTSFLDASNVYGSTAEELELLRNPDDGLLKSDNNFLPMSESNCEEGEEDNHEEAYVAGDMRVNENPGLQALHTLWMREHNRLAIVIKGADSSLDKDIVFEEARRFLIAEMQNIIYSEFLPIVLGPKLIEHYGLSVDGPSQYLPHISPNIFNGFATAAFRFGHSLITEKFHMMSPEFKATAENLSNHFFRIALMQSGFYDSLLLGMTMQRAEKVNNIITSEVQNSLFREEGHNFGSDLPARNIQRSRDHELGTYDAFRQTCGLRPLPSSFFYRPPREIRLEMWLKLKSVYAKPKDIDLFPGGLAENPVQGGIVGPTFACIIGEQFRRLKFGDR